MNKNDIKQTRVAVIIGTRPEAIKLAPVVANLQNRSDRFKTTVVATGQHQYLLDQTLSVFHIQPDMDLNVMTCGQGLAGLTGRVLDRMSETLNRLKPDIVLVQGDTTTVFATALAAFYQKIPVAHVEAGLRTQNRYSPFPEEINRRLTTVMTDIHFTPTLSAKNALLNEGIDAKKIVVTGNTVVDALLAVVDMPFSFSLTPLKHLDFDQNRLLLVTSHRRESWGWELENICQAIKDIVKQYPDVVVVYPVHPNPVVKKTAEKILSGMDRIHLVEPLDYLTFIQLMKRAFLLLTDSGGLQEEAPSLKKPLLLLREVTERPDAFAAGLAKVVGTDRRVIVRETAALLDNKELYRKMTQPVNPYGDGRAAGRIVKALSGWASGETPLMAPHEEFGAHSN